MKNSIVLPYITLALNLAFATTTDFENEKMLDAEIVSIAPGTDEECYVLCSEYYGLFIDQRIPGGVIRYCFGTRGIEEVFVVKENDVRCKSYIKIRYGKSMNDARLTIRKPNGECKSINFSDLSEDLKYHITVLNSKQSALEAVFGM